MPEKETGPRGPSDHKGDRYANGHEPDFTPKIKRMARKPGPRKTPRFKFRDFAMI